MTESVVLVGTRKGCGSAARTPNGSTGHGIRRTSDAGDLRHLHRRPRREPAHAGRRDQHPFRPWVFASDDGGRSWSEAVAAPVRFPEGLGASVERIWQIQPGTEPGVVYAGTQPSALFRSTDGGRTFEIVRSLWDHPHRTDWGAGFGGQAIHTIVPHPTETDTLTVAMATGGVYRTQDAFRTASMQRCCGTP